MDQGQLRSLENKCTQENPPACTAICPIHVDVRAFMQKLQEGKMEEAFEVLRKKQPFPGIIGRICDHPCQRACKRLEVGEDIAIANLEKYCVENHALPVKVLVPPPKQQSVGVVGGGLSGLTVAFDLAKKGYRVTLFEASDKLGGRLWDYPESRLPRQVLTDELEVLQKLGVEIQLGMVIGQQLSLAELRQRFDVVYLGLGQKTGSSHGLQVDEQGNSLVDPITFATPWEGVFAGGSMVHGSSSVIESVSQGRRAAISLDRYLQKVSLTASRENEGAFDTSLFTNTTGIEAKNAVSMANPQAGYSREEAGEEAGRCLQCECLECVKACSYLRSYNSYPKKYLREIYNNESIVMGNHKANKMINSCSSCGLCAVVCPNNLDMGEVCQRTRERMVERGKMPPSAHDFAMRDLAFNNSDKFAMTRHQPGTTTSKYLFLPGCQLSGSDPELVEQTYAYLCERLSGGTGLMLHCCGAPAEWAGQQQLFQEGLQKIRELWENSGKPRLILACPTCFQMFRNNLPELELVSLWEIFNQYGLPIVEKVTRMDNVAVHDACNTRFESQIHQAVRDIITRLGYRVEELTYNRDKTKCCGFGGLMSFANPEMAANVVEERTAESPAPYVSYCAMCRDNFATKGKPSLHLLDLIFHKDDRQAAARKSPGFSQRHDNRARLKSRLLEELWGEKMEGEKVLESINLIIDDTVKELMEQRLILVEDIQKVIEFAERTGNKLVNKENEHFLAYRKDINVTYWVEYAPLEDGFEIYNTYSHRMGISEEVKA